MIVVFDCDTPDRKEICSDRQPPYALIQRLPRARVADDALDRLPHFIGKLLTEAVALGIVVCNRLIELKLGHGGEFKSHGFSVFGQRVCGQDVI